eukprot:jgi/Mesen1/3719/ME000202S02807
MVLLGSLPLFQGRACFRGFRLYKTLKGVTHFSAAKEVVNFVGAVRICYTSCTNSAISLESYSSSNFCSKMGHNRQILHRVNVGCAMPSPASAVTTDDHDNVEDHVSDITLRQVNSVATSSKYGRVLIDRVHENVVIADPEGLLRKKRGIREAGASNLQVIADFDMTLTRYYVNYQRGQSCHALLVTHDEEINEKRRLLQAEYHPLEIDPTIPFDEKFKLMEEWWSKSHELILQGGLSLDTIQSSVKDANIGFRAGCTQLFSLLEVIRQKLGSKHANIQVVSNRMQFDSAGRLIGFPGKVMHVLNKNEHALDMAASSPGGTHSSHEEENGRTCEGNGELGCDTHDTPGPSLGQEEEDAATPVRGSHRANGRGGGREASETWGQEEEEEGGRGRGRGQGRGQVVRRVRERTNVVLLGDHLGDLRMSDGVQYDTRITVGFL